MVFGFFLIRYWHKQIGNGYYQSNSADAFDKLKGSSLPPPWQGGALPDELQPHI